MLLSHSQQRKLRLSSLNITSCAFFHVTLQKHHFPLLSNILRWWPYFSLPVPSCWDTPQTFPSHLRWARTTLEAEVQVPPAGKPHLVPGGCVGSER